MPKRPPKEVLGSINGGDGPFLFAAFGLSLVLVTILIHLLIQVFTS